MYFYTYKKMFALLGAIKIIREKNCVFCIIKATKKIFFIIFKNNN